MTFPETETPWDRAAVEQHEEHWNHAAEPIQRRAPYWRIVLFLTVVSCGSIVAAAYLIAGQQ